MEKFSTWRDASSGIAPFVLPVPTGNTTTGPLFFLGQAVLSLFAVIRLALFFTLVTAYALLEILTRVCPFPLCEEALVWACSHLTRLYLQSFPAGVSSCCLAYFRSCSRVAVPETGTAALFRLLLHSK